MRLRIFVLTIAVLVAALPGLVLAQTPLPPDVLPIVPGAVAWSVLRWTKTRPARSENPADRGSLRTDAPFWVGLAVGTLSALSINVLLWTSVLNLPGQGGAFLAASVAFVTDVVATILVSRVTTPKPAAELRGFVYSETPVEERSGPHLHELPLLRRPVPLAIIAGAAVIILNVTFH